MPDRVYLDHSATTPVDPLVIDAMMPYLTENFGNASSIHFYGQQAKAAVDRSRHQAAELLNSAPNEIIFTSGGTESNNLAIRGILEANKRYGSHVITSVIEHPSVFAQCEDLEKRGYDVTYLTVDEKGLIDPEELAAAIRPDTILVSIMTANNEIGTIQPIAEIGKLIRSIRSPERKIWFHTDAVQAVGKINVDVEEFGCDLLSFSGHKINAPKGIGGLYVRRGTRLHSQNIGGRQERGIRGGTEPVANIAAIGAAAEIARDNIPVYDQRVRRLRDTLSDRINEEIADAHINGDVDKRLPNILNISFDGIEGEALLINLDMHGIAVSTGSACSSGSLEPSPVIRALGLGDERARSGIRFSFGTTNDDSSIEKVMNILPRSVESLRRLNN